MAAMADQAAVKEYIAKYQLEDELSAAVNMAIKQNSDDPFGVISEYLKTLANEKDDDDDDDVIMEEDEQSVPAMKPRGRRDQVMAAAVDIPEGFAPPVYEKSSAQTAWLKDVLDNNKLTKFLTPSDRGQLLLAFQEKTFEKGTDIIKQGAAGDNFYILDQGECDIKVNDKLVMKAVKGVAFGELALLQNAPRAATVTANDAVTAWVLDILSFKCILMGKAKTDATDYMKILDTIELLNPLKKAEKQTLCTSMKEKEFPENKIILCEGEEGNTFYLIRDGEVKCTKNASGATEVSRRLKTGDFFGELALLNSEKRAATVTAVKKTQVLMIDRSAFERVVGVLSEITSAATTQARN